MSRAANPAPLPRKLFLDDVRNPGDVTWMHLPPGPYHVVRSAAQFTAHITAHGVPDHISFDNDLGVDADAMAAANALLRDISAALEQQAVDVAQRATTALQQLLPTVLQPEGRQCARWLVTAVLDGGVPHNPALTYTVHSRNTVAAPWITQYMDAFMAEMASRSAER